MGLHEITKLLFRKGTMNRVERQPTKCETKSLPDIRVVEINTQYEGEQQPQKTREESNH